MKLLADECVDKKIVERLRSDGHEVSYIAEMSPGIPDEDVLAMANKKKIMLLTSDKDFGELVFRKKMIFEGVIFLRLEGLSQAEKAEVVSAVIQNHSDELIGSFTVITQKTVRIRQEKRGGEARL